MKLLVILFILTSTDFDDPTRIANLEKLAADNPDNWQARLELVELFIRQSNLHNAEKYIQEAEESYASVVGDSCNARLRYLWGELLDHQDNIPAAMAKYIEAVECDPSLGRAWRKLGYLYEIFGNFDQMLDCFIKALPTTDDSSGLYYDIGVAYDNLDNLLPAIECYNKCLALGSSTPEAYLNIGVDWGMLGYQDSATFYFEKAAEAGLESPELFYNIGIMMLDSGANIEALDNFMRTLAVDPNYSPAKLQLGNIYEIIGDSGMARVYFDEFIKTAPLLYSDDIEAVKNKLDKHYSTK
ncbi:MAG: tetratricopeptide repeat protein [candidate division Zixibacteria bacterium]|nr:tetratricopeptide repeat protein [candidate division Zixibacteria bacterium]